MYICTRKYATQACRLEKPVKATTRPMTDVHECHHDSSSSLAAPPSTLCSPPAPQKGLLKVLELLDESPLQEVELLFIFENHIHDHVISHILRHVRRQI